MGKKDFFSASSHVLPGLDDDDDDDDDGKREVSGGSRITDLSKVKSGIRGILCCGVNY